MNYNYHTHTYLCNHAEDTPEEYVKKAINGGIKRMGFSDHMPHIYSNGFEAGYRVPVSKAEEYIAEVKKVKEKYKDHIEIILGFEMEYFPEAFAKMCQNAKDYGAEYLIYGCHYYEEMGTYCGLETDETDVLKKYVTNVVEAMKTGVYTYIAHPDLINYVGEIELYEDEMRKICVASKETGIPLEINFLGIRTNRVYPRDEFWKIAGEEKCPVTYGFDAHDADGACDLESLTKANELVEKYELNYIGEPQIIFLD